MERGQIEKTQLFDLMRRSTRDVAPRGFDRRTGFGILDIPTALKRALPPIDPMEPNDDVDYVKAHGISACRCPAADRSRRRRAR